MKPLAQHITESLAKEESQPTVETVISEAPESILDIANIAPEKEKVD